MVALFACLASLAMAGAPQKPIYSPSGPVITFVMRSGKKFSITTDPKTSPKTVAQIVKLVKSHFYDRQRVHRVEPWVIQWGAPQSKDQQLDVYGPDGRPTTNPNIGDGGSGHQLPFEANSVPFLRGVVGIASVGVGVGGDSQIFILKKDTERLTEKYAVLGRVTAGMDVVDAIQRGERIEKATVKAASHGRR